MGGNAFPAPTILIVARFPLNCVAGILRKHSGEFPVALLNQAVILQGEAGENHPAGGILDKALHRRFLVLVFILDLNSLIAVVNPGGAAEKDRRVILLRKIKRFLYHLIGFRHGGRVKNRNLRKLGKGSRILLGLGGNGAGVICHHHHQAALDPHIFKAHQGVRSHIEPHLLHGHHGPCAAVGRPRCHLHGSLLIDRPFHIDAAGIALRHGLQHLSRGSARISCHQLHPCRHGPQGNGFIAHQKFSVHNALLNNPFPEDQEKNHIALHQCKLNTYDVFSITLITKFCTFSFYCCPQPEQKRPLTRAASCLSSVLRV